MKTFKALTVLLILLAGLSLFGCKKKTNGVTTSTTSQISSEASYRVEYYFESEDGYSIDESKTQILTGEINKTVIHPKQSFTGYAFESGNKSNVIRGKVLEDGSLVLKAYYTLDYTGRITFECDYEDGIDLIKGEETQIEIDVLLDGVKVTDGISYASSYKAVTISDSGLMEGRMRGESEISVTYKNISKSLRSNIIRL